MKLSNKSRWRF